MFNKLILKNFQSIADAEVPLSRVSVVAGPSNLGKSALCRAVRTLFRNSFDSSYLRIGEKEMKISLEDSEDGTLSYERKSSPKYVLNGQAFEKMGKVVPQTVQEWLRCTPADIEGISLDLNIQSQFDPPFLLTQSGPDLARILGRLLDIDSVLEAQKKLIRDKKSKEKEIDALSLQIEGTSDWLKENAFLEGEHVLLESAKELDAEISILQDKEAKVTNLLEDIRKASEERDSLKSRMDVFTDFPEDLPVLLKKRDAVQEADSLRKDIQVLQKHISAIDAVLPVYEKTQHLIVLLTELQATHTEILNIQTSLDFLTSTEKTFIRFFNVKDKLKVLSDEVRARKQLLAELSETAASIESMKQEMVQTGFICPVTNRPVQEACFYNG